MVSVQVLCVIWYIYLSIMMCHALLYHIILYCAMRCERMNFSFTLLFFFIYFNLQCCLQFYEAFDLKGTMMIIETSSAPFISFLFSSLLILSYCSVGCVDQSTTSATGTGSRTSYPQNSENRNPNFLRLASTFLLSPFPLPAR